MITDARADRDDLDAGEFSTWMVEIEGAIAGHNDSDVACGTCTGCCTASQFIHIRPDEHDALAHIPKALLFPAPRAPRGHVLMGYDEHGRCPMLIDDKCSIYAHRPRTCRTYDCRVFTAAGLEPDDETKAVITERVRRWRFSYASEASRRQHEATRSAATFLAARRGELPAGTVPESTTPLAVLAVELHEMFADSREPGVDAVSVELTRRAR